ncbi:MAG TPA: sulfatase-like hydrolase/transferase [Vicinamibacteria bacterium]|nr:sulfatase-like hydrolase/transferase [Vicinamibacteria bacterium]
MAVIRPLLAMTLGAVCAITFGCKPNAGRPERILLVTIDTLRADHLGYMGYDVETPNLDALAASGVVFTQAVTTYPMTLPSHTTIMSGLYPPAHGTRNNGTFRVPDDVETVAETLKANGYATAAFVGAFVLDSRFGLEQGFDVYDDDLPEENEVHKAYYPERRAEVVVSRALDWIRAHESEPFFVWVHVFDPHAPHNPPSPFAERYPDRVYDAEVAYTDHALGPLLRHVQAGPQGESAAIVLTSDHGESLGEHGESTHALFVYDATIRVPLIVKAPGRPAGHRVEGQVRTVDIAPTILELAGVESPEEIDGVSLFRYLDADTETPVTAYGETFVPRFNYNWSELRFLRTDRYKVIDAPRRELYDLAADPEELNNLWSDSLPAEARPLVRELGSLVDADQDVVHATLELDEETARRLESLGYVTGQAPGRKATELADPKDRVEVYERLQNTLGRDDLTPDQLIQEFREVLALEPENATARQKLANTLAEERRYEEALVEFRELLRVSEAGMVENLGVILLLLDDVEEALTITEAGIEKTPWDPDMHVLRGEALERANRLDEAVASYEKAIELRPEDAQNYWRRGAVRLKLGDGAGAEEGFRQALQRDPNLEAARLALARQLSQSGRAGEAKRLLEEGAQGGESSADWKAGFAEAQLASGDLAEARALLEDAHEEAPENTRVLALLGPLCGQQGDLERAAALLEKAISLGERGPDVRRNLGLVYLRRGDARAAIAELLAASESAPEDPAIWFSLGNAYLRSGKFAAAVEALERSVALEPDRQDARFNLALAYERAGERALAAEAYRRFLATGVKDEARRAEAERRIAELESR